MTSPISSRANRWQLCCVLSGSLHLKRVAGFSEICRAAGKCELCRVSAPFISAFDESFLEPNHIVWLTHGGSDNIENTVALCLNRHRKMYVVKDAKDIKKLKRCAGWAFGGQRC